MVWPAKIFEITEGMDLGLMAGKLKSFREEEEYRPASGRPVNLVSEILDLKLEDDVVSGVLSKDFMRKRIYRREVVETPVTEEAPFWIKPSGSRMFLIVIAPSVARGVKKLLTNYVANKLSKVLFITPHAIVETTIPHDRLTTLHESNPQATRLIWFDQVDLPGVEKLCLAGSGLADTDLYRDYLNHGKVWYVVFEAQERGITVGVTRNSVVTLFSRSTVEEFRTYLLEDVLVLIE